MGGELLVPSLSSVRKGAGFSKDYLEHVRTVHFALIATAVLLAFLAFSRRSEVIPALLPIGEAAEFRIHNDKLILRDPEADGKEREYVVVSMTSTGEG